MEFGCRGFKVPEQKEFLPVAVTPAKDAPTWPHQAVPNKQRSFPGRTNWFQYGGNSVLEASTSNGVSAGFTSTGFVDQNSRLVYFPEASNSIGVPASLASMGFVDQNCRINNFPEASRSNRDSTCFGLTNSVNQASRFDSFPQVSSANGVVHCLSSKSSVVQNSKLNFFPEATTSNGGFSRVTSKGCVDENSRFNNWDAAMGGRNLRFNHIADSSTDTFVRAHAGSSSNLSHLKSAASGVPSTPSNGDNASSNSTILHRTSTPSGVALASASEAQRGSNNGGNTPLFPGFHPQVGSCYQQFQATASSCLMQGGNNVVSIPFLNQHQVHSSDSMLRANHNSSLWSNSYVTPKCHYEVSAHRIYDLNALDRSTCDSLLKGYMTDHLAPVTPDNGKKVKNQCSEIRNAYIDVDANEKKDEQHSLVVHIINEGIQSEQMVDSAALCTPLKKNENPSKREDYEIDLNLTPEQKSEQKPKRKKHRPKVVIEGTPKRSTQLVLSKEVSSKEKPPVKRKYVRRKGLKALTTLAAEDTETENSTAEITTKNTRRELNFDSESQVSEENAGITLDDREWQPPVKRKYVRRKGLKALNTPLEEAMEINKSIAEATTKNTRRALNFDLQNQLSEENTGITLDDQDWEPPCSIESSFCRKEYNFRHQAQDSCTKSNSSNQTKPMHQRIQGLEMREDHPPAVGGFNLNSSSGQTLKKYILLPENSTPTTLPPQGNKEMLREDLPIPSSGKKPAGSFADNEEYVSSVIHQNVHVGITNDVNLDNHVLLAVEHLRGAKRERYITNNEIHLQSPDLVKAHYDSLQAYKNIVERNGFGNDIKNLSLQFPQNCKRKRTEKGQIKLIARTSPNKTTIDDTVGRPIVFGGSDSRTNNFSSQAEGRGSTFRANYINDTINLSQCNQYSPFEGHIPQEKKISSNLLSQKETQERQRFSNLMLTFGKAIWNKKKRSRRPTRVRDVALLTTVALCKQFLGAQGCIEALLLKSHAKIPKKPRTQRPRRHVNSVSYFRRNRVYMKRYGAAFNNYNPLLAVLQGWKNNFEVRDQTALVPFRIDNKIVPYEGPFDPRREHKPRPKVDLDSESERVWKLLMDGNEGVEEPNADKEQWWKEERRVFKGRVDSFIARMHLVQGDRRYLRWKGSVVDSVIGVFLTQNVTDHFSSSAFMSLAARYPLQSSSNHRTFCQVWPNMYIEQPEVDTSDSDDIIILSPRVSVQSAYDQGSNTFHEDRHMIERRVGNSTESKQIDAEGTASGYNSVTKQFTAYDTGSIRMKNSKFAEADDRKALENIVPSQNSAISLHSSAGSATHPVERTEPCSGFISKVENLSDMQKSGTLGLASFMDLLNMSGDTLVKQYYNNDNRSLSLNVDSKSAYAHQVPKLNNGRSCMGSKNSLERKFESTYPSNTHHPLPQVADISRGNYCAEMTPYPTVPDVDYQEVSGEESRLSFVSTASESTDVRVVDCVSKRISLSKEHALEKQVQDKKTSQKKAEARDDPYASIIKHLVPSFICSSQDVSIGKHPDFCNNIHMERSETFIPEETLNEEPQTHDEALAQKRNSTTERTLSYLPKFSADTLDLRENMASFSDKTGIENTNSEPNRKEKVNPDDKVAKVTNDGTSKAYGKVGKEKKATFDWDSLRKEVHLKGIKRERSRITRDSLDWEAVRCAHVNEIADTIKHRGMNNMLAERIKDFLNRLVREHESIDLEWLRDVSPDKAKEFLLSIWGLGLKSVECVRLLTLDHHAFPVDTNVARIAVRLGWVPLQPLPENLQIHLLELYPLLESVQKYLWPRLCTLDQKTLYELHYQMITFGKVFCTKRAPNCNACPLRAECRHFASAFASAKFALPGPEEKGVIPTMVPITAECSPSMCTIPMSLPLPEPNLLLERRCRNDQQEPIIEEPTSPEPQHSEIALNDIEDYFDEDPDEIPTIKLSIEEFALNLQSYVQEHNGDVSKALVALTPEAASIPSPKFKTVTRLRTEHQVYILPDGHPLLNELQLERRELDDPCNYLLAMWTPGEIAEYVQPPKRSDSEESVLFNKTTNILCEDILEESSQTVRGTILIPSKTAMRGSFPLNGTYFQVNEVFADHESSLNPIKVPRDWLWNLQRRTVFFGTSVTAIFRGLSAEVIQSCFWKGYVCVRGFDQKSRAPRPLAKRFHIAASRLPRNSNRNNE